MDASKKTLTRPHRFIPWLIAGAFFIVNFLTLSHYGVNWDEPYHFSRGQAYLHYFLTSNPDYADLPPYQLDQNRVPPGAKQQSLTAEEGSRRSVFQHDQITVTNLLREENGHPPLNDILSAAFNRIFYGTLGILGDIESHHLFNVFTTTLLVLVVALWAQELGGWVAGAVAGLAAATYPLFVAESHFNIKDPVEAAFFTITLWGIWKALTSGRFRWWILAGIAAGLALGTKFNIFFAVPIVGVWLFVVGIWSRIRGKFTWKPAAVKAIAGFFVVGALAVGILWATWPFLWQHPWSNFLKIVGYYRDVGTTTVYQPNFLTAGGYNLYPLTYLVLTTPTIMLLLATVGSVASFRLLKHPFIPTALFIAWIVITLGRVSLHGSALYGGIRQIAEIVPPLAILAGLGASALVARIGNRWPRGRTALALILVGSFIPTVVTLVRLHPNENVFFNSFIGGLKGAAQAQIPSVGNTYGNAYYQGIRWLNENAPEGARFGLANSTMASIPQILVRKDLQFANHSWSGPDMLGEYEMELNYDGLRSDQYSYQYLTTFLEPVWELKVDGVVLLRIWKNDQEHARYPNATATALKPLKSSSTEASGAVRYDLGRPVRLWRLDLATDRATCPQLASGFITTSVDGTEWERQPDNLNDSQPPVPSRRTFEPGTYTHWIALTPARYIRLHLDSTAVCSPGQPTLTAWEWSNR